MVFLKKMDRKERDKERSHDNLRRMWSGKVEM